MGEDLLGLKKNWTEALDRLQAPLSGELLDVRRRMEQILRSDFEPVNRTINHLFSRAGKMIRPTLLLLAADRRRGDYSSLVSLAAAVEIIHTASLVHDDSIDSSTHRHGVETLNSKWNHKTSVIIGDYLLAQAFGVLAGLASPDVIGEMSAACRCLALGEMRQMALEGNLVATEQDYYDFILEKTASLFSASCAVAAVLGDGRDLTALRRFGALFGTIFQITDDLLDYSGYAGETGKPTGLDIREKKMTLPLIHACTVMDPADRTELTRIFASDGMLSEAEAERVAELVIDNGGIDYAIERVVELAGEASRVTEDFSDPARASKLKELVELIVERDR
ncbi:polyprenyl synthetase family protein [bacterium]|nr:polyprenyl synthetase family protein [bacterium]